MTDLRCSQIVHAKSLGPIIELKCREHSRRASGPTRRVTVYHRWEYDPATGSWAELNDRMTVRDTGSAPDDQDRTAA